MDDSGALPDENYIIDFGSDNITGRDDEICEINDQEGGSNCWASIYANDTLVFDEEIQTYFPFDR